MKILTRLNYFGLVSAILTGGFTPAAFANNLANHPDRIAILQQEVTFYETKVKQQPDSGLELAALANSYWKMGRATGAEQWLPLAETTAKKSIEILPFSNNGAKLTVAQVAQARHAFAAAETIAQDVLKAQPKNSEAVAILATTAIATGKLNVADTYVQQLVTESPNLNTLTLQALVEEAQGKNSTPETFRRAIAMAEAGESGGVALAETLLGRHYYYRGDLAQAAARYQAALTAAPDYPLAILSLAALATRQGDYAAADRYYQDLLAKAPEGAYVYDHKIVSGQARVARLQGKSNLTLLNQIEEMVSGDTNAFGHRRELAHVLLERNQKNDRQMALQLMETEIQNRQDSPTLAVYAQALAANGKLEAARAAWKQIMMSGVKNPGMYWQAAQVEMELGDRAQAELYRSQARKIDPNFTEATFQAMGIDSV
jgi:tetratricopeptide (TPR) repeat protein